MYCYFARGVVYMSQKVDEFWLFTLYTFSRPLCVWSYFYSIVNLDSDNIKNKLVYKDRPHYQDSPSQNPNRYWKFAITNVLNILRYKKDSADQAKRAFQVDMLTQMLIRTLFS